MFNLSTRRLYLDLIETYKIILGFTKMNRAIVFELVSDYPPSLHKNVRLSGKHHYEKMTGLATNMIYLDFAKAFD